MKFSIVKLFQTAFRLLMIFMLVFIWVRYYNEDLNFSVWLSVLITLAIEILFKIINQKRMQKLGLKQSELKLAESTINQLMFNTTAENINILHKILSEKETVKKYKNYLIVTNASQENFALYPAFSYSSFSVDELAQALQKTRKLNLKKLIICTRTASKETYQVTKNSSLKVTILEGQEVYAKLFKAYGYTPKETETFKIENISKEPKFKDIIKNAISSDKTKSYFFSSLILLFASYFVKYKIYYIAFSSLLLVLSITSLTSLWWKKNQFKTFFSTKEKK